MEKSISKNFAQTFTFSFALLLLCLAAPILALHHDLGWHLISGKLVIERQAVPVSDPWSFTAAGFPWINISWAWDCIVWLIYQNFGFTALLFITALIGAIFTAQSVKMAMSCGADASISILCAFLMLLCILAYELPEVPLSIAPQTTTLLLLTLLHARLLTRNFHISVYEPFLFIIWGSLHSGFISGFVALTLALGRQSFQSKRFPQIPQLVLYLLCLLAPLLSPYGWGTVVSFGRHIGASAVNGIQEWHPFNPLNSIATGVYILIFLVLLISRRMKFSGPFVVESLLWLVAGLRYQRNIALFLISSVTPIAVAIPNKFKIFSKKIRPQGLLYVRLFAVLIIIFSPFLIKSRFSGDEIWTRFFYPKDEISYIRQHLDGRRLLNDWNFGSFIVFESNGQIPVFIDGRGPTAYPPELIDDYMNLSTEELVRKYHIQVIFVPRYRQSKIEELKASDKWRLEFEGKTAIIFNRVNTN